MLRDFHSPNLLWLPERAGIARVGLLDFQDAVMGPAAYDLASLLQDARVDVPEVHGGRAAWPLRQAAQRKPTPISTPQTSSSIYATLAAQRASKILGIFSRLDRRDGKPQYLRHIPRVWGYLQRSLAHPALPPLKTWYDDNVPAPPVEIGDPERPLQDQRDPSLNLEHDPEPREPAFDDDPAQADD